MSKNILPVTTKSRHFRMSSTASKPIRRCRKPDGGICVLLSVAFAALTDSMPSLVALDLAEIRAVLDLMVPIQAKVSRKRWANLRSDLSAAIAASGLLSMIKTSCSRAESRAGCRCSKRQGDLSCVMDYPALRDGQASVKLSLLMSIKQCSISLLPSFPKEVSSGELGSFARISSAHGTGTHWVSSGRRLTANTGYENSARASADSVE